MGLLDFIKNAFQKKPDIDHPAVSTAHDKLIIEAFEEQKLNKKSAWDIKPSEYEVFKKILALPDKEKVGFIINAVYSVHLYGKSLRSYNTDDINWKYARLRESFISGILRTKLTIDEADFNAIFDSFLKYSNTPNSNITSWPIGLLLSQLEKQASPEIIGIPLKETLLRIKSVLQNKGYYGDQKDRYRHIDKIDSILFRNQKANANAVRESYFPTEDEFGSFANSMIRQMTNEDQPHWFKLVEHAKKAKSAKPSNKYLDEARGLMDGPGTEKFKKVMNEWMEFITKMKERTEQHSHTYRDGTVYNYNTHEFIDPLNTDIIKGFIWMCTHFHDKSTLFNLATLAERAYRKIPGKGPAAATVGNAAFYALANSKGLDGVGHLSRLKTRIKQNSTQTLIDKYLNEAAKSEGVSLSEIEDMAVSDYGLVHGKSEHSFDDYKFKVEISGVGKVSQQWYKPDGSPQKSVPASVKESHSAKLKKLKDTIKQIELTVTGQRDRIDQMFKSERRMSKENFIQYYLDHGLMSYLTKRLIWNIEQQDNLSTVFCFEGKWVNSKGEEVIQEIAEEAKISLWHPVMASLEEVRDWREFMLERMIIQPVKQAYREIYILTDAEINTRVYSNRMAAHILKQHQFNSLAKSRGWKYSLRGGWDTGYMDQSASLVLPEYGLRAEFWINDVVADDALSDSGIWLYVATDQVRFFNTTNNDVIELINIPKLALSETLRDVDLFVGVASVGNDPAWRDSGALNTNYRDYWQSYSFGELNEVAKTRKTILERLVPRLKIAKVAEIRDRYLVVKGKLRTYKIHLGSTNILMEPNDQYLCIVADRSQANVTENMFLPFEGDNGLSLIISKALLLADDDKITDSTITRQINAK